MIRKGMNVLFVAPKFFGYEQAIKSELESMGCFVDWFDDRPSSTPLVKALIRFKPELIASYSNAYFDLLIEKTKNRNYDVVFVIKGEALSVERLNMLKQHHVKAKFLYYSWDSLKNFKNSLEKLVCFDKVYSFDRNDCLIHSFVKHLPLFYTAAYENMGLWGIEPFGGGIDLLFLGSIHSDRYTVVEKIWRASQKLNPNIKLFDYFFYQSKWVFAVRKLLDKQFRKIPWKVVRWSSLSEAQVLDFISKSKIVVDVNHPGQKGLTMRTIESLGAQRKLITTNKDVANYDFFCPDNILIVDRNNPVITSHFISSGYVPLSTDVYKKYSLTSWLQEIFS